MLKNNHTNTASLVFPATHPAGREYLAIAAERNERVIAASSVQDREFEIESGELILLPYVHESSFPEAFLALVNERNVTRVYAPVLAVYSWLSRFIAQEGLALQLIGDSPIKVEVGRFHRLMAKVRMYRGFIDACAGGKCDLSDLEVAAIFRMSEKIYGESNDQKIAALMGIFSSVPQGDVVEIGSLAGKSAAVLTVLARRYKVGHVLAIDPWQLESARQYDSPAIVREQMVGEWEYDVLPQDFIVNMFPVGLEGFNYLRLKSAEGFEIFKDHRRVSSETFGSVDYQGRIAIIHIDGNHDYAQVKLDCDLWLSMLDGNGWLVLDDYVWSHGDGPHRVGDELIGRYGMNVERMFVSGKALFVKFCASS